MVINGKLIVRVVPDVMTKCRIIVEHPSFDYMGQIEVDLPTKVNRLPDNRKTVPTMHLSRGILRHSKDIVFNSTLFLSGRYYDLLIIFDTPETESISFNFTTGEMRIVTGKQIGRAHV